MTLKGIKSKINNLFSATPLFAYISANRIGHQGLETMLHCACANKIGRRLIIIYSNNVANKSFNVLRNSQTMFVNLCWFFNIINNKLFLYAVSCLYKVIVFLPRCIFKVVCDRRKFVQNNNTLTNGNGFSDNRSAKVKYRRFGNDLMGHVFDRSFAILSFLRSGHSQYTVQEYYNKALLIDYFRPLHVNCKRDGESILTKIGLLNTDWFVCLHVRESSFLGDTFREWQNQGIDKYLKAIKHITELGGYVIRMGDPGMKKMPAMKNIIDYAHSKQKSSFADVYLSSKARFAIVNNSGYRNLPQLFGTPLLTVNMYPITPMEIYKESLIIYKKVYSRTLGRELKLKEILNDPTLCHYNTDDEYKNAGIEIRQNSEDEILDAVVEMVRLVTDNTWGELNDDQRLFQSEIKKYLKSSEHVCGYGQTMFNPDPFCRIGSNYMRDNWT